MDDLKELTRRLNESEATILRMNQERAALFEEVQAYRNAARLYGIDPATMLTLAKSQVKTCADNIRLIEKMQEGLNVALITDAGTPGISDPGEVLAAMCYDAGIEVTSLPGPAACITALTLSGLSTRRFAFEAFLPPDKKERKAILEELKNETRTIILYEAPHHLVGTLQELYQALGNRRMTLCRELTKKHETAFRTTIEDLIAFYKDQKPLGECVLVIEGRSRKEMEQESQESWKDISIEDHMAIYENQGIARKEAMKMVAKDRGVTKRDIYQALLLQK